MIPMCREESTGDILPVVRRFFVVKIREPDFRVLYIFTDCMQFDKGQNSCDRIHKKKKNKLF